MSPANQSLVQIKALSKPKISGERPLSKSDGTLTISIKLRAHHGSPHPVEPATLQDMHEFIYQMKDQSAPRQGGEKTKSPSQDDLQFINMTSFNLDTRPDALGAEWPKKEEQHKATPKIAGTD